MDLIRKHFLDSTVDTLTTAGEKTLKVSKKTKKKEKDEKDKN